MREARVLVENRLGLHARAAAKLVQLLSGFQANVTLCARDREINGKSIMGVMMLAAGQGSEVVVRADGADEDAALAAAQALFARRFDEES